MNIPGVEVLTTEISEREISIHVKIASNFTRCHRCGEKATEYYCDGEMLPNAPNKSLDASGGA